MKSTTWWTSCPTVKYYHLHKNRTNCYFSFGYLRRLTVFAFVSVYTAYFHITSCFFQDYSIKICRIQLFNYLTRYVLRFSSPMRGNYGFYEASIFIDEILFWFSYYLFYNCYWIYYVMNKLSKTNFLPCSIKKIYMYIYI